MTPPLASFRWIHGSPRCADSSDPTIQVLDVDQNTYVLRLSKCFSYEANFLYLLFGRERAILFDTGARSDGGTNAVLPLRRTVDKIIAAWRGRRGADEIDLVVAHTHSHGDHVSWDGQFEGRSRTRIVPRSVSGVANYFDLPEWPEGQAELDLGGRRLTVFPVPGHERSHIAAYDPRLKLLLTGDTLYPGLLTVRDWPAFRRSAERLADFAAQHDVDLVLGSHIEMSTKPGALYPIGTTYQPDEHSLPLGKHHIVELHAACEAMANSPRHDVHDDFVIEPL